MSTGGGVVQLGRNIVVCLNGTNSQYIDIATITNVVKSYAMVDESRTDQLPYYQPWHWHVRTAWARNTISYHRMTRLLLT
jgi:hypothetical protein